MSGPLAPTLGLVEPVDRSHLLVEGWRDGTTIVVTFDTSRDEWVEVDLPESAFDRLVADLSRRARYGIDHPYLDATPWRIVSTRKCEWHEPRPGDHKRVYARNH